MVNCNPETVSTDYDTSDRLYFEPLTLEDVLEIIATEENGRCRRDRAVRRPDAAEAGARAGSDAGVPILGTSPDAIDLAEDRERFGRSCCTSSGCAAAERHRAHFESSRPRRSPTRSATRWWCGRPTCSAAAAWRSRGGRHPLRRLGLLAAADHAGRLDLAEVRRYTEAIARGVGVRGLLNVQYALKDDVLYVLEANPRASRTVPFVSKATAVPLAKAAAAYGSLPTSGRSSSRSPTGTSAR
jgi:carbamoylphosphate synthase large subunit